MLNSSFSSLSFGEGRGEEKETIQMEFDFLKPINDEVLELVSGLNSQHLGSKIVLHTSEQFPDLNKIKIAIIGVLDNRGDSKAISDVDLTAIRKEFYSLYPGNWEASIADLGDILPGNSIEDTYFALKSVVSTLRLLKFKNKLYNYQLFKKRRNKKHT